MSVYKEVGKVYELEKGVRTMVRADGIVKIYSGNDEIVLRKKEAEALRQLLNYLSWGDSNDALP